MLEADGEGGVGAVLWGPDEQLRVRGVDNLCCWRGNSQSERERERFSHRDRERERDPVIEREGESRSMVSNTLTDRCRVNHAWIRESGTDSGLGLQVKVLATSHGVPCSL